MTEINTRERRIYRRNWDLVRLADEIIDHIIEIFSERDEAAVLYLYGSRCDLQAKGGDIDILVHSSILDKQIINEARWDLMKRIGEQKIDITLSKTLKEPFVQMILPKAVKIYG